MKEKTIEKSYEKVLKGEKMENEGKKMKEKVKIAGIKWKNEDKTDKRKT